MSTLADFLYELRQRFVTCPATPKTKEKTILVHGILVILLSLLLNLPLIRLPLICLSLSHSICITFNSAPSDLPVYLSLTPSLWDKYSSQKDSFNMWDCFHKPAKLSGWTGHNTSDSLVTTHTPATELRFSSQWLINNKYKCSIQYCATYTLDDQCCITVNYKSLQKGMFSTYFKMCLPFLQPKKQNLFHISFHILFLHYPNLVSFMP